MRWSRVVWLTVACIEGKWSGRRVVVLYRGHHFGSYKSRGRSVTVDANKDKVHANHASKLVEPLLAAGANVTILACTYHSQVLDEWLARSGVMRAKILETRVDGRIVTPNELIVHAYDLVLAYGWAFDTLVSIRADIFLKRPFSDVQVHDQAIVVPWKEANRKMPHSCTFRRDADESPRCHQTWITHGERYADAVLVAPIRMLPDLRFAVTQALSIHDAWDQHTTFQHLKKQKGYTVANVSNIIPGYWYSNPKYHSNPFFSLARHKREH